MPACPPARCFRLPAAIALGLATFMLLSASRTAVIGPSRQSASLPACGIGDVTTSAAGYEDWQLTLLDTTFRLPAGYVPPDLVPIADYSIHGTGEVRSLVTADLAEMARAAQRAGVPFSVVSAYRSEQDQAQVLAGMERSLGTPAARGLAARPGHSEHQLGTAVDLGEPSGAPQWEGDWGLSPQGKWLAGNAWRYGFMLSYPRASSPSTTCYEYEPWHFRYFGRAATSAIHASGLAPRAYLWTALVGAQATPSKAPSRRTRPR